MVYKILIVDDEERICEILEVFLTKKGFDVLTVSRGEQALELFDKKEKIDLLILDKKMPGIGGVGVFFEVQKRRLNIPAIILTGSRRMAGYEDEAEKMGYAELLFKPVDLEDLLKKIKKVLGIKEQG